MKSITVIMLFILSFSCQAIDLEGHCQTKLRVHKESSSHHDNVLILDIAIEFIKNNKMVFFLEGSTQIENKMYSISRYLTYSYEVIDDNVFKLNKLSVDKLHFDNAPDNNITEEFGIYNEKPIFRISKIYGNYLFANQFSPVFICITTQ